MLLGSASTLRARSAALYLKNVGDETVYYSVACRYNAIFGFHDWKVSGWYELKPRARKRVETLHNPGQLAVAFFKRGGAVVYPLSLQGKALVRYPDKKVEGWYVSDTEPHNFNFGDFSEPSSDRDLFLPASYDMYFPLSNVQMSWQSHYELEVEVPSRTSDTVVPLSGDTQPGASSSASAGSPHTAAQGPPVKGRDFTLQLPDGVTMDFVYIRPGTCHFAV